MAVTPVFRSLVIVAALSGAACAGRLQGNVEYDHGADFRRYRSFALLAEGTGQPENRKIAQQEIARRLIGKGLSEDPERPDLQVSFDLGRRGKVATSGASGWGTYGGIAIEIREPGQTGFLWRGLAAMTIYEDTDPAVEIPKAVELLLSQFPPQGS